ncbi:unknown [Bacteroides sp. CAG:144]|nr:unknown [Bacteroides sp. CAG:144]
MIPQFIPTIWNMTDNNTAHDAHKNPFQLLSPKAMAHKTPLYPINPAFKLSESTPSRMAIGIGSSAPNMA